MNCIKQIFTIAVLVIYCHTLAAQENPSNSVYLELFGNGGFYTFNYEKSLHLKNEVFNLRIGFGDYPIKVGDQFVHRLGIPIGLNKEYQLSEWLTFQAGLGASYIRGLDIGGIENDTINITEPSQGIYLVPSVGFLVGKKRLFLRINYDPLFAVVDLTNKDQFDRISDPVFKRYSELYYPKFQNKLFYFGLTVGFKL